MPDEFVVGDFDGHGDWMRRAVDERVPRATRLLEKFTCREKRTERVKERERERERKRERERDGNHMLPRGHVQHVRQT
jgi:hypothetical protein